MVQGGGTFCGPSTAPAPVLCPACVSDLSEGAASSSFGDAPLRGSSIPTGSGFPQVLPPLHRDLTAPS